MIFAHYIFGQKGKKEYMQMSQYQSIHICGKSE